MGIADVVKRIKKEISVLTGNKSRDRTYLSKKEYSGEEEAARQFEKAKQRLFDVNGWSDISGPESAGFQLFDQSGKALSKQRPSVGNYIKIDLPGPFPMMWVKVTDVKDQDNVAEFTVRPAHDPTEQKDKELEHFFEKQARSLFKVEKKGNMIIGYEIGKNEAINQEQPQAGDRTIANFLLSEGGWAGYQKLQWKLLTDYLVGVETY